MFSWLFQWFAGHPASATSSRAVRMVRARYDAAVTSEDNRRHWANADGLSANAANGAEVRRILRNRARYEVANNSYLRVHRPDFEPDALPQHGVLGLQEFHLLGQVGVGAAGQEIEEGWKSQVMGSQNVRVELSIGMSGGFCTAYSCLFSRD